MQASPSQCDKFKIFVGHPSSRCRKVKKKKKHGRSLAQVSSIERKQTNGTQFSGWFGRPPAVHKCTLGNQRQPANECSTRLDGGHLFC